jgi:hypothetical protein
VEERGGVCKSEDIDMLCNGDVVVALFPVSLD